MIMALLMHEAWGVTTRQFSGRVASAARSRCHRLPGQPLDQYLVQRGLPVTPSHWNPAPPLVASIEEDGAGIETTRLWRVLRRFFVLVADAIQDERPGTAEKLRRASPHWMRHTHASHALARGTELIMVRDNLRHSSISTTSTYLHSDEVQRARQFDQALAARDLKR